MENDQELLEIVAVFVLIDSGSGKHAVADMLCSMICESAGVKHTERVPVKTNN